MTSCEGPPELVGLGGTGSLISAWSWFSSLSSLEEFVSLLLVSTVCL